MKHVIRRVGLFVLPLVCIGTLSSPGFIRSFLYRQLYPLVAIETHELAAAPEALRARGYREDDPSDLAAFQSLARETVRGATTDGARLRALGDMLYSFRRPGAAIIPGGREQGVQTILSRIQNGEHGLCGHNTQVLAALWRSLGRDFREIRFTSGEEAAWFAAHYGIEVYTPETRRWFYYDVSLNGYAVDEHGAPMSLLELDQQLADGRDVAIVASTAARDWDAATFMSFLRQHQSQVFSLNNELRGLDADRRFGRLNFAYGLLSRLPRPLDRVVDALTGDAAPRLVLSKRPPPPSARATLHLTAIPPID